MSGGLCRLLVPVVVLGLTSPCLAAEPPLRIPANTAYSLPNPEGIQMGKSGTRNWRGGSQRLVWYVAFAEPGELRARILVRIPEGSKSRFRLGVADAGHEAEGMAQPGKEVSVLEFGPYTITNAGYQALTLTALNGEDRFNGEIQTLELEGPAILRAHANLDPRRNAASVHLAYPLESPAEIDCFAADVTALEDPVTTFYMACGFSRGYFGMQVNSPTERRIIFSIWDAGSGGSADTRATVAAENHVTLVAKGPGVHTEVFGHEGTGGHSHLKYLWKTGEPQRFLVTAEPVPDRQTIYSGYYFHPERREWMLISSMRAPKDGGYLRGLHSFSENFGGSTGHLLRKARFANQRIRSIDGQWRELTAATFSHDPTGRRDRRDRFMGVEDNSFFLSHGGFVEGYTDFGKRFERPATAPGPAITPGELPPRVGSSRGID